MHDSGSNQPKACGEFQREVLHLLRSGRRNPALGAVRDALRHYPDDPLLLSYHGYLISVVEKDGRRGVGLCQQAIDQLNTVTGGPDGTDLSPYYLNLSRACLAAGNKKSAIKAIQKGLTFNPSSRDLIWELKRLGTRRSPPIPFLGRNNPLNKLFGRLRHKVVGRKIG